MGLKIFRYWYIGTYDLIAQWRIFFESKSWENIKHTHSSTTKSNSLDFEIKKYGNVDTFWALQASLSPLFSSSCEPSPATAACSSSAAPDTWTRSFSKLIFAATWSICCTRSLSNFKSWSSICPFSVWKAEFWPAITASRPTDKKVVKMEKVHRSCIDADQSIQKQWTQKRQRGRN